MAKEGLQEKIATYRFLESRMDALSNQRDVATGKINEINSTIGSIGELEKTKGEVLFPVGSSAFIPGKISEQSKVIVEIGANIAIEKNFEDAKKALEKNREEIEKIEKEIENEMRETSKVMETLAPEIESMAQK